MTKIFYLLLLLFVVNSVQSQKVYCNGNLPIGFGGGLITYIMNDFDCSNAQDSVRINVGAKVYVDGQINTNAKFVIKEKKTSSFSFESGQLIVNDDFETLGEITVEQYITNTDFNTFSFPLDDYLVSDLENDIAVFGASLYLIPTRNCPASPIECQREFLYNSSLLYFDNYDWANIPHYGDNPNISKFDRYTFAMRNIFLPVSPSNVNVVAPIRNKVVRFTGKLSNGFYNIQKDFPLHDINYNTDINGLTQAYNSPGFVYDPFINDTSNPDYGDNLFAFANPFTSNIDISKIGINEITTEKLFDKNDLNNFGSNLLGVSTYRLSTQTGNTTLTYTLADINGDFVVGSKDLIVKPKDTFGLKFKTSFAGGSIIFKDGIKTFSSFNGNDTDASLEYPLNRYKNSNKKNYQIKLVLKEKEELIGDVFIHTNYNEEDNLIDSKLERIYSENINPSLYSLDEDKMSINEKIHINGINIKQKNSIPLIVDYKEKKELTLSVEYFTENLKEINEFPENIKFYFRDNTKGLSKEIDKDFKYSFNSDSDLKRFEIFLNNDLNGGLIVNGSEEIKVYKDKGEYFLFTPKSKIDIIKKYLIFNSEGKFIKNGEVKNQELNLKMKGLIPGQYYILIENFDDTKSSVPFMIN